MNYSALAFTSALNDCMPEASEAQGMSFEEKKNAFVENALEKWPRVSVDVDNINDNTKDEDGYVPLSTASWNKRRQQRNRSERLRRNMLERIGKVKCSDLPSDKKSLRFPQDLMMEYGDPSLVGQKNQKIQDCFDHPQEHMAEVISYFHTAMQKLENLELAGEKFRGMKLKDWAFAGMTDQEIAENWEQLLFAATMIQQFQNFERYFTENHIQPVDDTSREQWEAIQRIMKETRTFERAIGGKEVRLHIISNPYYEFLDLNNPETQKFERFASLNKQVGKYLDDWCAGGERKEEELDRFSQLLGDLTLEKQHYAWGEIEAARRLLIGRGVSSENLYIRIAGTENAEGQPCNDKNISNAKFQMACNPDAVVEVYDVSNPEMKFTLYGSGDRLTMQKAESGSDQLQQPEEPNGWQKFWNFVSGGYFYKQEFADYDRAVELCNAQRAEQNKVKEFRNAVQEKNEGHEELLKEESREDKKLEEDKSRVDSKVVDRGEKVEITIKHLEDVLKKADAKNIDTDNSKITAEYLEKNREILNEPEMEKVCYLMKDCTEEQAVAYRKLYSVGVDLKAAYQTIKELAKNNAAGNHSDSEIVNEALKNQTEYQNQQSQNIGGNQPQQNGFSK